MVTLQNEEQKMNIEGLTPAPLSKVKSGFHEHDNVGKMNSRADEFVALLPYS